jgi:predicted kinase
MIIIVFGLPGTGKSYFSEKFAKVLQASWLNTDSQREKLKIGEENNLKVNQKVYEQLLEEMAAQIQYRKKVIVEGTFHSEKLRNLFLKKARKLEQDVFYIEIKADDEKVLQRLKKREGYSDADFKVYLQIKSAFEPVYQPHLVLWSDDENVEEMIEKANIYIYGQEPDLINKKEE